MWQNGTLIFGLFEWHLKTFLLKLFQYWLGGHFEGLTKGYHLALYEFEIPSSS